MDPEAPGSNDAPSKLSKLIQLADIMAEPLRFWHAGALQEAIDIGAAAS